MRTSYSRRRDHYVYEIEIHDPPTKAARFRAHIANFAKLKSGQHVTVNTHLQDEHGRTPAEAFSKIEAAVETWLKGAKAEDFKALAKRAHKEAERRIAESKAITERVAKSRGTKRP